MTTRAFLIAALLTGALAGPGVARAGSAASLTTVSVADVPLRGERSLSAVTPRGGFDLVGIHWRGGGSVEVRVRSAAGRWGPWLEVAESGPDPGSAEAASQPGWRLGEGLWVGGSRALEVRTHGTVTRARAWTVRSRVSLVPTRAVASAGRPPVVLRAQWQADESLRREDPVTAPALRFAVVHHTAGPNTYSREQAPAVVRAIMAYHVRSNGWNDIGYNALVDRFGTVYEGRYGGLDRNVVGAHAKGFNTGSFGIAVLGELSSAEPTAATTSALARMLAWRLDLAHVDPLASVQAVSAGNERFPPGIPVLLRAISGHRDTGLTECPGSRLYAQLPALARQVSAIGLPKIYDPVLTGAWGGTITLTARLSGPAPWTVTLTGEDGAVAAVASGSGTAVTASWETAGLAPAAYSWAVETPGATAATGSLDASAATAALAFVGVTSDPAVISPDGDGTLDTAAITYRIPVAANVSATVVDALGAEVAVLEPPRWRRAGEHVLAFDGLALPDGAYGIRLDARASGDRVASATVAVAISRTLARPALVSASFTPNGDGRGDRLGIRFRLAGPAGVRVRILRHGAWVATPFTGSLEPGDQLLEWDGGRVGGPIREGDYTAELEVTDAVATTRVSLPFVADWTPPRVRVVSIAPPRIRIAEPARLLVVVNGLWRRLDVHAAGVVRLPWVARIRTLRVVARDAAGNVAELRLR